MILFVDDEVKRMSSYKEELEHHYPISFQHRVEGALEFFEQHVEEIQLLILDIMMGHGKIFGRDESAIGRKTGVLFYRLIRQRAPDLPVIIFTNSVEFEEEFRGEANCRYLRKKHYYPGELVEVVRDCLNDSPLIG